MKPLIFSAFILLFLTVPSFRTERAASSNNDEYEVLSVVVNELYLTGDYKLIVITNPSCCEASNADFHSEFWRMYKEQLISVSTETMDDYVARNKQSLTFERKLKLKTKYKIVPYEEIERLFGTGVLEDAWRIFNSKYPASNGFVRLSRVGFNKAKDQAVVSVGWRRGPLYGEGHYVLLEKQNGSWRVLKKVPTWMS